MKKTVGVEGVGRRPPRAPSDVVVLTPKVTQIRPQLGLGLVPCQADDLQERQLQRQQPLPARIVLLPVEEPPRRRGGAGSRGSRIGGGTPKQPVAVLGVLAVL